MDLDRLAGIVSSRGVVFPHHGAVTIELEDVRPAVLDQKVPIGQEVKIVDRAVGPLPFHLPVRGDGRERSPRVVGGDHAPRRAGLLGDRRAAQSRRQREHEEDRAGHGRRRPARLRFGVNARGLPGGSGEHFVPRYCHARPRNMIDRE